jgi:hypothetical protein
MPFNLNRSRKGVIKGSSLDKKDSPIKLVGVIGAGALAGAHYAKKEEERQAEAFKQQNITDAKEGYTVNDIGKDALLLGLNPIAGGLQIAKNVRERKKNKAFNAGLQRSDYDAMDPL